MDSIDWQPSTNSILDLQDWTNNDRLEIRPSFQRKSVWGEAAKIMLMDTILKNIPMPKIFVSNHMLKENNSYRSVIDGQQRILAILGFIRDEFSLKKPYDGEFLDRKFSELPKKIQNNFLRYKLDFNEINDASDEQLREIYSRVNRYSTVLNKQELRRSDFPGDFLKLAEELAVNPFFEDAKIFSITNRRRFLDAEYVSELLAGLIDGIQDKKNTLDDFYKDYADWDTAEKDKIKKEFVEILKDIHLIFNEKEYVGESGPITVHYCEKLKFTGFIGKTRFKQKSDFYALFFAISKLKRLGYDITNKDLANLRTDLIFMHKYTNPHSDISLFREYATKCLSDANSKASREWRVEFLFKILSGTYIGSTSVESNEQLSSVALDWLGIIQNNDTDLRSIDAYGCPSYFCCGKCGIEDDLSYECEHGKMCFNKSQLYWDNKQTNYQLTNSKFICGNCLKKNSE